MKDLVHKFCQVVSKDASTFPSLHEWLNALSNNQPGDTVLDWLREINGPPPKQTAHSHLADLNLMNRLAQAAASWPDDVPQQAQDLLCDIWEAVKPGDIGSAISEVGILSFATEQWGDRTFEKIGLKACAEAGEFAQEIERDNLEAADMEAGDVLVVLSQYAAKRGTSLDALRAKAFRKCQERVDATQMKLSLEEDFCKNCGDFEHPGDCTPTDPE